jgi:hypothetical protein
MLHTTPVRSSPLSLPPFLNRVTLGQQRQHPTSAPLTEKATLIRQPSAQHRPATNSIVRGILRLCPNNTDGRTLCALQCNTIQVFLETESSVLTPTDAPTVGHTVEGLPCPGWHPSCCCLALDNWAPDAKSKRPGGWRRSYDIQIELRANTSFLRISCRPVWDEGAAATARFWSEDPRHQPCVTSFGDA